MSTASSKRYEQAKADMVAACAPKLVRTGHSILADRAAAAQLKLSQVAPRPLRMQLMNCAATENRPPKGARYIGRAMPGISSSPLGNPFGPKSARGDFVIPVDDEAVLEHFKRWLVRRVVEGACEHGDPAQFDRLRELTSTSVLACWCVDRNAVRVGANRSNEGGEQVEQLCHGDVIWSVWQCLEDRGWVLPWTCFGEPCRPGTEHERQNPVTKTPGSRNKLIGETTDQLYDLAFGAPMQWGAQS